MLLHTLRSVSKRTLAGFPLPTTPIRSARITPRTRRRTRTHGRHRIVSGRGCKGPTSLKPLRDADAHVAP
eukprot:1958824-Prymnesium_polylepis.1